MKKIVVFVAAFLTGCIGSDIPTVTVVPGAQNVIITEYPKDVKDCKIIGPAEVSLLANDTIAVGQVSNHRLVQNYTYGVGGDVFFATAIKNIGKNDNRFLTRRYLMGIVYNCSGTDFRQPLPTNPYPK